MFPYFSVLNVHLFPNGKNSAFPLGVNAHQLQHPLHQPGQDSDKGLKQSCSCLSISSDRSSLRYDGPHPNCFVNLSICQCHVLKQLLMMAATTSLQLEATQASQQSLLQLSHDPRRSCLGGFQGVWRVLGVYGVTQEGFKYGNDGEDDA